jgi:hypothetical protein
MRQLEVLTIFYAHACRKGGRRTFPTMGDIGRQLNPPIRNRVSVRSHIVALWLRGDIEPRCVGEYRWRQYKLTPVGRKRAKRRALLMEKRRKKAALKERQRASAARRQQTIATR